MSKRKSSQFDFDNPLAEALNFDAADLDDNRQGFISHSQKRHLRNLSIGHETVAVGIGWAIFNAFGVVLFATTFMNALQQEGITGDSIFSLILTGVLSVFCVVMIGVGLKLAYDHNRDTIRDLRLGKTARITGMAEHRIRRSKNNTTYFLRFGDEHFMVAQWLQSRFEDGTDYTVYYAPQSRILLSAEVVESDP